MNKYKYPILAKPSGITLDSHRKNVMSEGKLLCGCYPTMLQKYVSRTGKDLSRRLEILSKFHDDGKEFSTIWQDACQKDYDHFLLWQSRNGGTYKDYVNAVKECAGLNIRKAGVRHEFQSLLGNKHKHLPFPLQVAIAAHHAKLCFKDEDRWKKEGVRECWIDLIRESNRIIENHSFEEIVDFHYEYAGPRGLLQLADHRASAKEDNDFVPDFTSFQYSFPHEDKRGAQKLVEQYWSDDLLLLRAPTGAGKTDASLLWASLQIQHKRADRLIIAMPTRFTSNALAINVTDTLSDTGLYHSSAWFTNFQEKIENKKIKNKMQIKFMSLPGCFKHP